MTLEQADRHCRNGAIAGYITAVVTLLVVFVALMLGGGGELDAFADPWSFLDGVFVAICAYFIRRHSRAAALILVFYYIVSKVIITVETATYNHLVVGGIFLYFFARAVQGTWAWHRLQRAADPAYRAAPRWAYWTGIPAGVLLLLVVALGAAIEFGLATSTRVVTGEELSDSQRSFLLEQGILLPDEKVEFFYSVGLFSIEDEGNLLTDQRVVSYERLEDGLAIYASRSDELSAVNIVEEGKGTTNTVLEIWRTDGEGFRVQLSPEESGDLRFLRRLRERIPAAAASEAVKVDVEAEPGVPESVD